MLPKEIKELEKELETPFMESIKKSTVNYLTAKLEYFVK
jgi:hypothetical protein